MIIVIREGISFDFVLQSDNSEELSDWVSSFPKEYERNGDDMTPFTFQTGHELAKFKFVEVRNITRLNICHRNIDRIERP